MPEDRLLDVTFYCPDRHILYEPSMPDLQGVGGGITARIRLASALAALGHRVTVVGNVSRSVRHEGAIYRPLGEVSEVRADVLVLNSTGGALDLSPLLSLDVAARLREVWVGGFAPLQGLAEVGFDFVVSPSNFIRRTLREQWEVPADKGWVQYNGVERRRLSSRPPPWSRRDPHRIAYVGYLGKGLEAACAVVHRLHQVDPRFQLHVFGGYGLWGQDEAPREPRPWLHDHGIVGQKRLWRELPRHSFLLALQEFPEPFGIAVAEAMCAGEVVVASRVGAFPELIQDGASGFLVEGSPHDPSVHQRAADLILGVAGDRARMRACRRQAAAVHLDWSEVARSWTAHWRWALARSSSRAASPPAGGACDECGAPTIRCVDGEHCTACGAFRLRAHTP